jgi:hypothetical protein
MSARLSLAEIKYKSWKGKTFSQITANIRENTVNDQIIKKTSIPTHLIMKPQPLKLYRKEIASVPLKTCNRRTSVKIVETPGTSIVNSVEKDENTNGLVNVNDPNLPNILGEYPGSSCDTLFPTSPENTNLVNRCLSVQNNALRKVRSAGMITRKFNLYKNNDTYYTSSGQYLDSRNKTFVQNTYHMLRKGDASCLPGSAASQQNVYASNISAHCAGNPQTYDPLQTSYVPVYYKPSNTRFAEQGGVSSSTRLLRLKYDTITDAGSKLRTTFGKQTASALAYSTTDSSLYSLKSKTGYPNKKTPIINPYSGNLQKCDNRKFFI